MDFLGHLWSLEEVELHTGRKPCLQVMLPQWLTYYITVTNKSMSYPEIHLVLSCLVRLLVPEKQGTRILMIYQTN